MPIHLETEKSEIKYSYRYDALGRRTATVNAEGTERHVWDGDHCLADVDEEGNVLRAYLWGPGVDNLLAVRVGGRNYAALTDIQGTVWGYADERGEIVARWTYDAWGNVITEEVNVPALAAVRYRFQGREFSRATGLTNFRARWYDPTTGRWLSKDPIGLNGGLNLYVFCGSDSINGGDPTGLSRVIIRDKKGRTTILKNPSLDKFRSTIQKMGEECIQELTIYDHGWVNVMHITGNKEGVYVGPDGRVLFDDTNQPFSDLLGNKMSSDGTIYLSGCFTAYDGVWTDNNISKALSEELPGVTVKGNRGAAFGVESGATWNFGISRSYKKSAR